MNKKIDKKNKKFKLLYFVSHPIQYQAPLLKEISNHDKIELTVLFQSSKSLHSYYDIGFERKIKWDINLLNGYNYKFLKILYNNKNSSNFFSPIVFGVFNYLKKEKWDAVWFHGYNHYSILWTLFLCRIMKIPFFMRMESNLLVSPKGKWLKDKFIKYIVKNARGLLYIGEENKQYYISYGASNNKLFSVPYSVDNNFFQNLFKQEKTKIDDVKNKLKLNKKLPIILFAGKFIKRKNPVMLLDAFASLCTNGNPPNSYLLFIGDGSERTILQNKVKELGLEENVRLLGFKNQTELGVFFSMCDVFVLPSEKEPYGLVINEVLNFLKPVITTTEVAAAKDLIEHNVNGFLYEPQDIKTLSQYLEKFINQRNLSSEMGKKNIHKLNNWSFSESVKGVYQALESL